MAPTESSYEALFTAYLASHAEVYLGRVSNDGNRGTERCMNEHGTHLALNVRTRRVGLGEEVSAKRGAVRSVSGSRWVCNVVLRLSIASC